MRSLTSDPRRNQPPLRIFIVFGLFHHFKAFWHRKLHQTCIFPILNPLDPYFMLKLIILSIFFIKTNGWDLGKLYPKSRKGQKDWLCDLMKFLISHANHSTPCFTHQISMHGPPNTHVPKIPPFSLYSKATTVREFRLHFLSHFSPFSLKNSSSSKKRGSC